MKEIQLQQNRMALVDDEDFLEVSRFFWRAKFINGIWYVVRSENGKQIFMHRQILKNVHSPQIDHVDGNGLNNQRKNLRPCTHAQNQMNSKLRKDNTSGYKGVSWHKKAKKWHVAIRVGGEKISIGLFPEIKDAVCARKTAEERFHGEFARKGEL